MTETKGTFHGKLRAAQERCHALNLVPEARGQVGTRNYKYLTIQKLHEAVIPILHELGLTWVCLPTVSDGPALSYALSDGEAEISDVMPLVGCTDMQKLGAAISYARRYCLLSVLGLTPDEDTDGVVKEKAKPEARQSVERQGPPKIPRDRALKIREQATHGELWVDGKPTPALSAYLMEVGCKSGKLNDLNVDQAEDVEAWIANESTVGKS